MNCKERQTIKEKQWENSIKNAYEKDTIDDIIQVHIHLYILFIKNI